MKDSDNFFRLLKVISLITYRYRTREEIVDELLKMGYDIPNRTFDRIIADIRTLGYTVSTIRAQGYKIKDNVGENPDLKLTLTLNSLTLTKERLATLSPDDIISQTTLSDGIQHIPIILDALQNSMTLCFSHLNYQTNKNTKYEVIPLNLLETNNRWYLVATIDESELRTFGLDRISDIEQNTPFTKKEMPETIKKNLNNYRNMLGVAPPFKNFPEEIMDITLAVNDSLLPYLQTKNIHSSQKITNIKDHGFTHVQLKLIPNRDFIKTLGGELGDIKIVGPDSLKKYVQESYPGLVSVVLL